MSRRFMALAAHATAAGGGSFTATISAGSYTSGGFGHTYAANTVVPSGGTAPYTYAWTITGDDWGNWSITGQGTASATPKVSAVPLGETSFGDLYCVVTDANSLTATSNTATYNHSH